MSDSGAHNESLYSGRQGLPVKGIETKRVANVKDNMESLLSKSCESKKQTSSQSHLVSGHSTNGGVSKPVPRKNQAPPIKSFSDEDEEDEDDEDKSNERKRRDIINEKIQELLLLIPEENFVELKEKVVPVARNEEEEAIAAEMRNSGTKDGKPNKGQILSKSVEYLRQLQSLIDENNRQEVDLIMKLKRLELQRAEQTNSTAPVSVGHTSAEHALGKIGVGPLGDDYFKHVLLSSNKKKPSPGS